jgi:hypothetical protein
MDLNSAAAIAGIVSGVLALSALGPLVAKLRRNRRRRIPWCRDCRIALAPGWMTCPVCKANLGPSGYTVQGTNPDDVARVLLALQASLDEQGSSFRTEGRQDKTP